MADAITTATSQRRPLMWNPLVSGYGARLRPPCGDVPTSAYGRVRTDRPVSLRWP